MSKYSCWRVRFEIQNSAGRGIAGPYTMPVGISGGSRNDQHTTTVSDALKTAVASNLATFLQDCGNSNVAAPGGTVALLGYDHATHGTPDIYV